MSNSQQRYHTVTRVILSQCPPPRITQTRDSAWFIMGVNGSLGNAPLCVSATHGFTWFRC